MSSKEKENLEMLEKIVNELSHWAFIEDLHEIVDLADMVEAEAQLGMRCDISIMKLLVGIWGVCQGVLEGELYPKLTHKEVSYLYAKYDAIISIQHALIAVEQKKLAKPLVTPF